MLTKCSTYYINKNNTYVRYLNISNVLISLQFILYLEISRMYILFIDSSIDGICNVKKAQIWKILSYIHINNGDNTAPNCRCSKQCNYSFCLPCFQLSNDIDLRIHLGSWTNCSNGLFRIHSNTSHIISDIFS